MESSSNGPSKVIMRSYVQETKLDPNGNKYTEKYFSNNYAMRGDDGTTVSERQQAYQNSLNKQQKIAEERMINNRGKKLLQERVVGGPTNKTQHFYNLDPGNVEEFDRDWDHYTNKFGFYEVFGKSLGYDGQKKIHHQDYQSKYPERKDYFPHQENYTNDDPVYLRDQPYYGRVRNNDLQPTNPGRALPMPQREDNRGRFDAIPLEGPRELEAPVYNERRNEAQIRSINVRGDGNFRNKNAQNVMPKAS